jgi:hypothetical protein
VLAGPPDDSGGTIAGGSLTFYTVVLTGTASLGASTITGGSLASGVIQFYDLRQYNYSSTLPAFAGGIWSGSKVGPATIVQLNDFFDQEAVIEGLTFYGTEQAAVGGCVSLTFLRCTIYGSFYKYGPCPTTMINFVMDQCSCYNYQPEFDKMVDTIIIRDSYFDENSLINIQSATINRMTVINSRMLGGLKGTPRDFTMIGGAISGQFQIGSVYGVSERMTLINVTFQNISSQFQQGEPLALQPGLLFYNGTFSNGIIAIADGATNPYGTWNAPSHGIVSDNPIIWAVRGGKITIYATATSNGGGVSNIHATDTIGMITAFTVLDVYVDGSGNYCVATTLPVLPSSTVTFTGTMSGSSLTVTPGSILPVGACLLTGMVVTAGGGGSLPANTTITVNVPIPNATNNAGIITLNSSATGSPTTFTATVPMYFLPHPCPRVTVRNCTGGKWASDQAGSPEGIPIYSYFRRAFAGFPLNTYTNEGYVQLCGNLLYWTVDVQQPFTGTGPYTCVITMFGWANASGNWYPTWVNQSINLTVAGVRTITSASGTTVSLSGDAWNSATSSGSGLDPVTFWLTGGHLVTIGPSTTDTNLAHMPVILMTAQTKQGVEFGSLVLTTPISGLDELADTVMQALT